jgi:hypothetical protein
MRRNSRTGRYVVIIRIECCDLLGISPFRDPCAIVGPSRFSGIVSPPNFIRFWHSKQQETLTFGEMEEKINDIIPEVSKNLALDLVADFKALKENLVAYGSADEVGENAEMSLDSLYRRTW